MPARQNPVASYQQGVRIIVKMQCGNRGSTNTGKADDAQAIVTPTEVMLPRLSPRIEQRYFFARLWVNCGRLASFVPVAERTGEPQIALFGLAPECNRDDVLNLKPCHHQILRTQAIAAAIASRFPNPSIQSRRNIGTHGSQLV